MLRVNNFDMKQKENMEYLFFHIPPDRIKVSECEQGTVNFSDNTTTYKKNQLQHIWLQQNSNTIQLF